MQGIDSVSAIAEVAAAPTGNKLDASLGLWTLTLLGVGATVGTGIFFVMAEAVPKAGPAVIVAFILAAITAGLTALCYAELASSVPASGSSYSYARVAFGDFVAFVVAACLLLEYALAASATAIGWSGYLNNFLDNAFGWSIPEALRSPMLVAGKAGLEVHFDHFNLPPVILVVLCAILLLRGVPEKNAVAHRGGWLKSADNAFEVRGKQLGIVGYGHIGTQIGVLAEQMGMRVVFRDIEAKLPLGNAREVTSLDELLATSDVVTLHVPETPQTHQLMGAKELTAMKPGSHLINASRGTVVDIEALCAVLESRHLQGAAIDVPPQVPQPPGTLLHQDLSLAERVLRDLTNDATQVVRIDSKLQYDALKAFGSAYTPSSAARLELYKGERPIFDLFNIEEEIARALAQEPREVALDRADLGLLDHALTGQRRQPIQFGLHAAGLFLLGTLLGLEAGDLAAQGADLSVEDAHLTDP